MKTNIIKNILACATLALAFNSSAAEQMKPMKGGGYERLAFQGDRVVETKNMKTGATHTPSEFSRDRVGGGDKTGLRKLL